MRPVPWPLRFCSVNTWQPGSLWSFPLVLVDEAQDLSAERSTMIEALARSGTVILAFDEFQCLSPALLPIAIEGWLRDHCDPVVLEGCRRTQVDDLIAAARAVRNGDAVNQNGRRFRVIATPGQALAATCLANAIAWRNGGNVAALTPSRQGGFANNAVARVCAGPVGRRQNGPFDIAWEGSEQTDSEALWQMLGIEDRCAVEDAIALLAMHPNTPEFKTLRDWLLRQRCNARTSRGFRGRNAAAARSRRRAAAQDSPIQSSPSLRR